MSTHEPLRVVAHVPGQISLAHRHLALDGILASQVALREQLPPPSCAADCQPIEIPIQREPGGRFHLCSFGEFELTEFDIRWVNRRAPVDQYQHLTSAKGKVLITAGPDKSYRLPLETGHLVNETITWWCIGDDDAIRDLLVGVRYLGKKRSVGLGAVEWWDVSLCDTWPGFPVLRDGSPLRTLPLDCPGLAEDPPVAYRCLTYPYWAHEHEELRACPQ